MSVELAGLGLGESVGDRMNNNSTVTVAEKKRWLMRYRNQLSYLYDLYASRQEELNRAKATTSRYAMVVVDGAKDPHKLDALCSINDNISRAERKAEEIKKEVLSAILTVKVDNQRKVLRGIYLDGKTPEAAGAAIKPEPVGERQAKRLHAAGLENIIITRSMIEKNGTKCSIKQ